MAPDTHSLLVSAATAAATLVSLSHAITSSAPQDAGPASSAAIMLEDSATAESSSGLSSATAQTSHRFFQASHSQLSPGYEGMPVDGSLREGSLTAIFDALTLGLDPQQPHSFIDLGCGTMRPTIAFRQYCVDHKLALPPYDLEVEVMRERYFVGIQQLLWAHKHLPHLFSSPPYVSCVCCDIQHLQSLGAYHDHAIVWIFNHVWIEMEEVMTHIAQLVKSQGGNKVEWIVCGNRSEEMQTSGFDMFRFYRSLPGKMAVGKEQRTLYIYHHIPSSPPAVAVVAANSVTDTAMVDSPSTASAPGQDVVVVPPLQDWDVLEDQLRAWQNENPAPRRAFLRATSSIHSNS